MSTESTILHEKKKTKQNNSFPAAIPGSGTITPPYSTSFSDHTVARNALIKENKCSK
jgi:hypothetical protein